MTINLEQIDGTIRTYEKALRENYLNDKEKLECLEKIDNLKKMKQKFLEKK